MRGTSNIAAFRVYVEGEQHFSIVDKGRMAKSCECFARATELDANFARAWGYRSYALARSTLAGWMNVSTLAGDALAFAERAVALDAEAYQQLSGQSKADRYRACDYAVYWDLAFVQLSLARFDAALKNYETAIYLYDNLTDRLDRKPGLLAEAAVAYTQAGDRARAIRLLKKSKLVPGWYRWNLGFAHYMEKDYEAALAELEHPDLYPLSASLPPEVLLFVAAATARSGDTATAAAAIERFRQLRPEMDKEAVKNRWKFQSADDQAHWSGGIDLAWK